MGEVGGAFDLEYWNAVWTNWVDGDVDIVNEWSKMRGPALARRERLSTSTLSWAVIRSPTGSA